MTIDAIQAENLFNKLYGEVKGYSVSTEARAKSGLDTSRFLYGELPFTTWKEIVEHANPKKDGVLFDLGSGTGRIVMASHLAFNFRKAIGVELLKGLHDKACEVKENFEKNFKTEISDQLIGRELKLVEANIFDVDLREADFIFMNHPFKDGEEFVKLEEKFLAELKSGTKIATIIRSLKNPAFKQLGSKTYKFSWGDSTTHFHEV